MKNKKHIDRLVRAGWKLKNIDKDGNVRFHNTHSVGYPNNMEPEFFWVSAKDLKRLSQEVTK